MPDHRAFPNLTHNEDHQRVKELLSAIGLSQIYGGGPQSKGHGFWIQHNGKTIYNDGLESGNPAFWMADEARQMALAADKAACLDPRGYTVGLLDYLSALTATPDPRLIGETGSNKQDDQVCRYGWSCLAHSTLTLNFGRVVDAVRWNVDVWCEPGCYDYGGAIY